MTGFEEPDKPYSEIESEFIRREIQNRDFDDVEDRVYVNKLTWLERYATEGASSMADSYLHKQLTEELQEEFDSIQKELNPEAYERRIEREDSLNLEEHMNLEKDDPDISELKKEWEKVD